MTHAWWHEERHRYDLFVSEVVLAEIMDGDQGAATRRLAFVQGVEEFKATEDIRRLALSYTQSVELLKRVFPDALHLAIASFNRVDYMLTWNCRHIAHADVRAEVTEINEEMGLPTPRICTPEELLYGDSTMD